MAPYFDLYNPSRDAFSFTIHRRQKIKDLEDELIDLISHLKSINTAKRRIDRSLRNSVGREKSEEYPVMESKISVIRDKYIKFINKYTRITGNTLSSTLEELMIHELGNLKSKIWTVNFLVLVNLSKDISKLSSRAREVITRLTPEVMIQNKLESTQEKLNDKHSLPVFDRYADEVLDWLCEKGNTVGIFGPYGVGKTTVLKKLYNQLIEYKSFSPHESHFQLDYVILIEYPTELETNERIIEKLQNEIIWQINIDHEDNMSIHEKQNRISAFLHDKKYIILMDHVPFYVDLGNLGLKEDHPYKKVVIASSDSKAINLMTEKVVEIQRLGEDDGWRLFMSIYDGKLSDKRKEEIVVRLIECCAGIPWMIYHVAKYLKHKQHESSWDNFKWTLQSDSKSLELIGLGGMDKLYMMMYEELEIVTKKCLLYGALFPNHHKIYKDYLIECWIAEGFLHEDGVKRKVRRGRDRGQSILDILQINTSCNGVLRNYMSRCQYISKE